MSSKKEDFRQCYSAKLCIAPFQNDQHPLHLFISKTDAIENDILSEKEFITGLLIVCTNIVNKNESSPTNSCSPSSSSSSYSSRSFLSRTSSSDVNLQLISEREIFVQLWIKDKLEFTVPRLQIGPNWTSYIVNNEDMKDLQLMCSEEFPKYYDINLSADMYFREVNLFPLKKVVFSVVDKAAFVWLQKVKFSMGLLIEVFENEVLVCKGCNFLAPYPEVFLNDPEFNRSWYEKMLALECLPLEVGKIDINTEIILSFDKSGAANQKTPNLSPSKNIFISDFCRSISFGEDLSLKEQFDPEKNPTFTLNASIVENQYVWKDILRDYDKEQIFDLHSIIGISKKLMVKFGLCDGTLLKISLVPEDEPHLEQSPTHVQIYKDKNLRPERGQKIREKLVMVKSLLQQLDNHNTVFISPLVLFNLHPGPVIQGTFLLLAEKLIDLPLESDVDRGSQSLSSSWSRGLPIATEVEITFINSPHYSPKTTYSQALKKYFRTPRLVSMSDVIAVKSADDPEFWQSMTADTGLRFPIMFFKVTRIESPKYSFVSHVVDSERTKLLQKSTAHSYVPKLCHFYMCNNANMYWNRLNCPGLNRYVQKLESLLLPFFTQSRPIDGYRIQILPTILMSGPVGCGKLTVIECAALRLCLHIQQVNCSDLIGETASSTEAKIKNCFISASIYAPCLLVLKNIQVLGKERGGVVEDPRVISGFYECIMQMAAEKREYPLVVIATTSNLRAVSDDMQEVFLHDIIMNAPDETNRFDILEALVDDEPLAADLSIKHIAQRTAGFVLGDLVCLVAHARREALASSLKLCNGGVVSLQEEEDLVSAGIVLQQSHFETALDKLQSAHSDAIGAPKIPNVTWDDVGGLSHVKIDILDTVQLPLQHPELLSAGLKRSGVLLYGPPGTGKTLLAKAVATECSLNFLSVKGPELINMYVGQSEENIREVFKRARSATPCVIFFDELDSLAPNRGKSADSGGVMDRVVSQLLAELDGVGKSCDVFVIGATNRPDLLDPALLRPGRFDKLLYLGISEDRHTQCKILKALTRKFHLSKTCKLMSVVQKCPWNMTGADFYALSSDAMLNAMKRKIQKLENGSNVDTSTIIVQEEDFMKALKNLVPSVTEVELERFKTIRDRFEIPMETDL